LIVLRPTSLWTKTHLFQFVAKWDMLVSHYAYIHITRTLIKFLRGEPTDTTNSSCCLSYVHNINGRVIDEVLEMEAIGISYYFQSSMLNTLMIHFRNRSDDQSILWCIQCLMMIHKADGRYWTYYLSHAQWCHRGLVINNVEIGDINILNVKLCFVSWFP
jgi:hypothetical protein